MRISRRLLNSIATLKSQPYLLVCVPNVDDAHKYLDYLCWKISYAKFMITAYCVVLVNFAVIYLAKVNISQYCAVVLYTFV